MSDIIDVSTIPHMKVTIPIPWNKESKMTATYYIGQASGGLSRHPVLQIHEKISGNDEGYCGSTLTFLMDDGSTEEVKGPFYKHADSTTSILFDILKGIQCRI